MAKERQLEFVTNLNTGEVSLRERTVGKLPGPTPQERINTFNNWFGQSNFAIIFAQGLESWRAQEAIKIAQKAGINVEFGSAQDSADEAEQILRKAFGKTRGTPIRSFDIVREIKNRAMTIISQKNLDSGLVLSYCFRVIDVLGSTRNLNPKSTENHKKYISSFWPSLL